MAHPEHFEQGREFAVFRPTGEMTREQAVQLITNAIAHAVTLRAPKLLVDVRGLTGVKSPGLGARYHIVREWASASRGFVCLALVIPAELADPEGFGITVARNMGMVVNRFADTPEAEAWLRSVAHTV